MLGDLPVLFPYDRYVVSYRNIAVDVIHVATVTDNTIPASGSIRVCTLASSRALQAYVAHHRAILLHG